MSDLFPEDVVVCGRNISIVEHYEIANMTAREIEDSYYRGIRDGAWMAQKTRQDVINAIRFWDGGTSRGATRKTS